ncbi:MAG: ABC transporter substrate binding protein [Isosphaeraceae bacterium]
MSIAAACVPKDQRRMGIVIDPGDPVSVAVKDSLLKADLDLMSILPSFEVAEVLSPGETAAAVEDLARRKVTILLLVPGRAIDDRALIGAATKARLPVFGYTEDQAKAGAVLARVPSPRWGGFEIGRRAGRLLKGTDPKALPFAEGTVFETIANRAASKEIGFNVRGEFLRTATFLP